MVDAGFWGDCIITLVGKFAKEETRPEYDEIHLAGSAYVCPRTRNCIIWVSLVVLSCHRPVSFVFCLLENYSSKFQDQNVRFFYELISSFNLFSNLHLHSILQHWAIQQSEFKKLKLKIKFSYFLNRPRKVFFKLYTDVIMIHFCIGCITSNYPNIKVLFLR